MAENNEPKRKYNIWVDNGEVKIIEMAENKMVEIDNPCYHCREGVIGECGWCKFACMEWARDVEADTVKIREDYLDGRE